MNPRRTLLGGIGLVALLAIVGVASRAQTPAGGGGTRALDGRILLEYVLLIMLALSAVVIPVGIWLFVSGRDDELAAHLPARKNWMWPLLLFMIGASIASVIFLRSGWLHRHKGGFATPLNALEALAAAAAGHKTKTSSFDWGPVIIVGTIALIVIAALAYWLRQTRTTRAKAMEPVPARIVAAALERTIAELREEADPRLAVIHAYAQMERAFADVGLPREASEAPREYLSRVLPGLGASADSLARLTSLFERAKFSPHQIDEPMKDEAISALEALREELA